MTNEQICDFIRQGGSDDLKPVLWERTKKLFYQLAQRRYNAYREIAARTGTEFSDCRQACYLAFNDALQDYIRKPQTVKFSSFAAFHVKHHINELMGLRTERQRRDPLNNCLSLDEPLTSESEDFTLKDTIEDETSTEPFEDVERQDVYRILNESVSSLDEPQRATIKALFYEGRTFKETGKLLNISEYETQRHNIHAMRNLRKMKEIRQLKGDYYRYSTSFAAFKQRGASSVELTAEYNETLIERLCKRI